MSENSKHGTAWDDRELDSIVADYFAMLTAELKGEPYVKSRHSSALMAQIERTHRSVEFKHQNISAVLSELGLPWIPGYKPKENFQNAIFGAIDRYLSANPFLFEMLPSTSRQVPEVSNLFVSPPVIEKPRRAPPEGLKRLIRKFDPAMRDLRNRNLGRAGEAFVLEVERRRLEEADRNDLARRVRWVAAEDGDGAGYDVLSFAATGLEYLIEVKTTNGAARTPFFLTRNESEMAANARVFTVEPPLEKWLQLRPETWRASFTSAWSPSANGS